MIDLSADETGKSMLTSGASSVHLEPSYLTAEEKERPLPFNATLNPLRIRSSPHVDPRSPSIEECEIIHTLIHVPLRWKNVRSLLNIFID